MGRRSKKVFYKVFFLGRHTSYALAAPTLFAIGIDMETFNITGMRDGDHHLFIGDEVFHTQIAGRINDLRTPIVSISVFKIDHFVLDDHHTSGLIGQDILEIRDPGHQFIVFIFQLSTFHPCQTLKPHIQDGLHLSSREIKFTG